MEFAARDLVEALSRRPMSVGDLGVAVAAARGHDRPATAQEPVGQWLASTGLSLSGLQQMLDGLVRDGLAVEVRGRELWNLELPTAGTKAMGRYYLSPEVQ